MLDHLSCNLAGNKDSVICRQLASFCQSTIAASRCLKCDIPVYKSVAECQALQAETLEALRVDVSLAGLLDVRELLQLIVKGGQGRQVVLQASQLADISTTIQCMLDVRKIVLHEECQALTIHAQRISEELEELLGGLQNAIDVKTSVIRDESSAQLAKIRDAKRTNQRHLQQEIDAFARQLHQKGASELKAPVMRRDRMCLSVKRGRSGVRSITTRVANDNTTYLSKPTCQSN